MSAAVAFEIEEQIVFKPIVTLTELWMKTVENTTRDFTVNAIKALSEKYNFPADEAIQFLGLENTSVNRKPMTKRTTKVEENIEEKVVKEEKVEEEKVKKEKKSPVKLTDEEKAEKKAKLEAERAEAKKLREEKEALEKAERAEKRKAELEAKKIEREEKQAKEKAEKEAKKAEEKAQKEAEKKAQKEAEKLKKAESKKSTPATSPTEEPKKKMSVSEITIDGKKYYINKETKIVYDPSTKEELGTYDETNKTIIKSEEEEEIEIEEN
jgi:hypothetical protein